MAVGTYHVGPKKWAYKLLGVDVGIAQYDHWVEGRANCNAQKKFKNVNFFIGKCFMRTMYGKRCQPA